jgi:acyl-homoserine-lactone acylase
VANSRTRVHTLLSPVANSALCILGGLCSAFSLEAQNWELAREVVVQRTDYGVPHVTAPSVRHIGFGLAYVQAEDHGSRVFEGLIGARGHAALLTGTRENIESDFIAQQKYERAVATYSELEADVRAMMEGFAEGVNHYLALHPEEAPAGVSLDFTGVDVHALTIGWHDVGRARRFVREMTGEGELETEPAQHPDDGSNAWALAPARTRSGRAILLRNPHLSWDAGYYEAHITVPGVLDFYGDFRVGGLFGIIAGFNTFLGWATTNNAPDLSVIYRVELDDKAPDSYLLDGVTYPLGREQVTVDVRDPHRFANSNGIGLETRTFWSTHLGPVIHRDAESVYIIRSSDDGEFRRGEQFLAMVQARSYDEWRAAMRRQHISASNYTYADRAGNIFYVWNAKLPRLPHAYEPEGAVRLTRAADVWSEIHPFDSLPQLLNPEGGYLHNENDPPYLTNLNVPLDRASYPENMPEPRFRLRSQLAYTLLHGDHEFTLETVVEAKHSMKMLLADRIKADLLAAVRVGEASGRARQAAVIVDDWDNTATRDAQGAVLFDLWWQEYKARVDSTQLFKTPWDPARPTATPFGLGRPIEAAAAFETVVAQAEVRFGRLDVAWGDVHRVTHGNVDVPVGGCPAELGCFRVLGFREADDGNWEVERGDGWVLAVEFGEVPRAYSVLAYGQSSREGSPHVSDQAALFADNAMKRVLFTSADVQAHAVERYSPGEPRQR